jgi:tRNA pseudouridine38-40 synthase
MPRIALGLEYDGTDFCGWQRQSAGRSVQGCVEEALARVADHPVTAHCAGRTDAGVHASGQVARFSARSRTYVYRIINQPGRSALHRTRACWVPQPLDAERMQAGALRLLGRHDFAAFRAAECQAKTSVRTLHRLLVAREGAWITIEACADAFLHHMVRNIAGVLIRIGLGDAPPEWASEVLAGRDRRHAGVTAPPGGLCLVAVTYDPAFALPGGAA